MELRKDDGYGTEGRGGAGIASGDRSKSTGGSEKKKEKLAVTSNSILSKDGRRPHFHFPPNVQTGTKRETSCSLPFWSGFTPQFVPPIFGTHHVRTHEWGCSGRYCVNKTTQHLCERVAFVPPALSPPVRAPADDARRALTMMHHGFSFSPPFMGGGERKRRERRSRIRGVYQISYGPRAVLGSNDRWNRGSAR